MWSDGTWCHVLWERYFSILTFMLYHVLGIPSHVDTHSAFEDPILSLSLLSDVVMGFKDSTGHKVPVFLPRRSLVIMSGESRWTSHKIINQTQLWRFLLSKISLLKVWLDSWNFPSYAWHYLCWWQQGTHFIATCWTCFVHLQTIAPQKRMLL